MTHEHTDAERSLALARMTEICESFYLAAVATGCHAFIEFTGLLGEFLQVCRDAEEAGNKTWMSQNVHGGEHMPMAPYRLGYLREKLACIYGAALFQTEDTPESDPAREAERVLSALAVAVYREPQMLGLLIHTIGHMVPYMTEAIGQERGQPWLDMQHKRSADAMMRATNMCEHTVPSPDGKTDLLKDALARIRGVGGTSGFAKWFGGGKA
jgi:hypothetical protein